MTRACHGLAVAGQALVQHLVVDVVGRGGQGHAGQAQAVHHVGEPVADQGDVLYALAVELHQELLDLAAALARLLVERDADPAIGRRHGLARQARVLALDVEVADLAEVEQLLVEARPETHAAAVDVVRQVVDLFQAVAPGALGHALQPLEVDVVDGLAVLEAVDQVQRRAAYALDGRQAQLHGAGGDLDGLRAQLQRALVGAVRVLHAERQAAGRGAVLGAEVGRLAVRLAVEDEVDLVLAVQQHVLGAVPCHQREAELLEHVFQQPRLGRCELDELEAHQAHGVLPGGGLAGGLGGKGCGHGLCLRCSVVVSL